MIDDLKPYPTYKDAWVPWLNRIPAHWDEQRVKVVLSERSEKGYPNESLLAATQTRGVVRKDKYENRTVTALKDLHLLKLVEVGDFVISLRSFQGGIEYARDRGIISPAYTVLYPRNLELHGYLAHLFKSFSFIESLNLFVTGIREGQNIEYPRFARSRIPIPPQQEQVAIVRYLDHVDRKINRYVRAKKKLIGLLNEQKQAIIHRAVTRGLDPNVRLKPSGVEWLGNVPEHWKIRKLWHCVEIKGGLTPSMDNRSFWGGDIPWVTPKDMKRPLICDSREHVTEIALQDTTLREFPAGAVLIVVRGMILARKVPIALTGATVTVNQDMKALIPRPGINSAFLAYAMDAGQAVFAELIDEAGHGTRRLPTERWRQVQFAFAPPEEQGEIAAFLDQRIADFANVITRTEQEIDIVIEYRTRLIADIVTGKLDVREAAAKLPDLEPEAEPLDEVEYSLQNDSAVDDEECEAAEAA